MYKKIKEVRETFGYYTPEILATVAVVGVVGLLAQCRNLIPNRRAESLAWLSRDVLQSMRHGRLSEFNGENEKYLITIVAKDAIMGDK